MLSFVQMLILTTSGRSNIWAPEEQKDAIKVRQERYTRVQNANGLGNYELLRRLGKAPGDDVYGPRSSSVKSSSTRAVSEG